MTISRLIRPVIALAFVAGAIAGLSVDAGAQTAPYAPYGSGIAAPRGHRYGNQRTRVIGNRRTRPATKARRTGKTHASSKVDMASILDGMHLTAAQNAKIGIYNAKADADGKAAYADRSLSQDQFIVRMDTIHNELIANIRAILTADQRAKFDAGIKKEK